MKRTLVASGKLPGFEFESIEYAGQIVHKVRVTGKIDLERRLPLYRETLAINRSRNYFCILDNSGGYENTLSHSDMLLLDSIVVDAGIENFYGVTITTDSHYSNIVKLANYSAEQSHLKADLLATHDPAEAERFILNKLQSLAG